MIREEPKHRLQKARADAGFDSPSEAARAFPRQINKNTLISHENGNRPISRKAAEKYGKVFGVDAGWILFDSQAGAPARGVREIPVVSLVSAGNLREQPTVTPSDIERWIRVADLPDGDWIALGVTGDSMNRIAPEGSTILVNRGESTLLDQRFYVFAVGNGDATFKQFRRRPDRLQPFTTNHDHMAFPVPDDMYVIGRVRRVITDV